VVVPAGPLVIVVTGAVVSIRNGPMCDPWLQVAPTRVRRWNHQAPSFSGSLVADVVSPPASTMSSGSLCRFCDHSYE
jgi:hypothetical protein